MGAVGNADGRLIESEGVGVEVSEISGLSEGMSAFSKRLWESWRRLVAGAISKVLWEGCGKVPEHFSKRSGSPSIGPSDAAASTGLLMDPGLPLALVPCPAGVDLAHRPTLQ